MLHESGQKMSMTEGYIAVIGTSFPEYWKRGHRIMGRSRPCPLDLNDPLDQLATRSVLQVFLVDMSRSHGLVYPISVGACRTYQPDQLTLKFEWMESIVLLRSMQALMSLYKRQPGLVENSVIENRDGYYLTSGGSLGGNGYVWKQASRMS